MAAAARLPDTPGSGCHSQHTARNSRLAIHT